MAHARDLPGLLDRYGALLGASTHVSRGDRAWDFALRDDGRLPADGAVPSVTDWGERGTPAPGMPDHGACLVAFEIAHPEPAACAELYRSLGLRDAPTIRSGPEVSLRAVIATLDGDRVLT